MKLFRFFYWEEFSFEIIRLYFLASDFYHVYEYLYQVDFQSYLPSFVFLSKGTLDLIAVQSHSIRIHNMHCQEQKIQKLQFHIWDIRRQYNLLKHLYLDYHNNERDYTLTINLTGIPSLHRLALKV